MSFSSCFPPSPFLVKSVRAGICRGGNACNRFATPTLSFFAVLILLASFQLVPEYSPTPRNDLVAEESFPIRIQSPLCPPQAHHPRRRFVPHFRPTDYRVFQDSRRDGLWAGALKICTCGHRFLHTPGPRTPTPCLPYSCVARSRNDTVSHILLPTLTLQNA